MFLQQKTFQKSYGLTLFWEILVILVFLSLCFIPIQAFCQSGWDDTQVGIIPMMGPVRAPGQSIVEGLFSSGDIKAATSTITADTFIGYFFGSQPIGEYMEVDNLTNDLIFGAGGNEMMTLEGDENQVSITNLNLTNKITQNAHYYKKTISLGAPPDLGQYVQYIQFPVSNYLTGYISIKMTAGWSNGEAHGILEFEINHAGNTTGGVYEYHKECTRAQGPIVDMFTVGDIVWNATSLRYELPVYQLAGKNTPYIELEFLSQYGLSTDWDVTLSGWSLYEGTVTVENTPQYISGLNTGFLEVYPNSNAQGINLYGLDETDEILDIHMSSSGAGVFSLAPNTAGWFDFRPNDTQDQYGILLRQSGDTSDWGKWKVSETYMNFAKNDAGATSGLVIDDNNYVGINKDPTSPLDVNGDINVNNNDVNNVYSTLYENTETSYHVDSTGRLIYDQSEGLMLYDSATSDTRNAAGWATILDTNNIEAFDSAYANREYNSATISTAGWYRIAQNGDPETSSGGSRAHAMFTVRDTASGKHSSVTFYASSHYGNDPTLVVLSNSSYGSREISKIRIVESGTYSGAAVEVYVTTYNTVNYTIYDNEQSPGWTPIDWEEGNVPTGFSTTEIDISDCAPICISCDGSSDASFKVGRDGRIIASSDDNTGIIVQNTQTSGSCFSNATLRLKPISQLNYDGFTSISMGSSASDNYGFSISTLREGTIATPSFDIKSHYNSADGISRLYIDNSGNIGLGTTDPDEKLEIYNNQNDDTMLQVTNINPGTLARSGVRLSNNDSSTNVNLYVTGTGYAGVTGWQDSGILTTSSTTSGGLRLNVQTGKIYFETGGYGSSYERMTLTNTGLGIKTNSPSAPLDLAVDSETAIEFDNGDSLITIHDGYGNFNFKSGVDDDNVITSSSGGSHIRLDEGGGIYLNVDDDTAVGSTFSPDATLSILNGEVTIDPYLEINGDMDISGSLSFGSVCRQMINLYGTAYSIGVQGYTLYNRSTANFAWFKGGVHSDTEYDPGTGGTVQMVLDENGSLGLGTTSPQYGKLEVKPTLNDANTGITLYAGASNTARSWLDSSYNWLLTRGTNPTAGLCIANSPLGNVGIGTTSPSYPLDVSGDVQWSGTLQGGSVPWDRLTSLPIAPFDQISSKGTYVWIASDDPRTYPGGVSTSFVKSTNGFPSYGTVLNVRGYTSSQDGSVLQIYSPYSSTYGGSYLRYRTGLHNNAGWTDWKILLDRANIVKTSETLQIDGTGNSYISGNLGIGTTSPSEKLHVNGKVKIETDSIVDGNMYVNYDSSGGGYVVFGDSTSDGEYIYQTGNDIRFYAGGSKLLELDGDSGSVTGEFSIDPNFTTSSGDMTLLLETTDTSSSSGTKVAQYYTFDATYNDKFGNYNGSVVGNTYYTNTLVTPKVGTYALTTYDGSNDYMYFQGPAATSTGDFTLVSWIYRKTVSSGEDQFFARSSSTGGTSPVIYIKYDISNSRFHIYWTTSGGTNSGYVSYSMSGGSWYHLAVVYDNSDNKMYVYVNGSLQGSITGTNSGTLSSSTYGVIGVSGSYGWQGYIDDFAFVATELSSTDISYFAGGNPVSDIISTATLSDNKAQIQLKSGSRTRNIYLGYAQNSLVVDNSTVNLMTLNDDGDLWVKGDCSADSFTDRCEIPADYIDAVEELKQIKSVEDYPINGWNELDHNSLPAGVLVEATNIIREYEIVNKLSKEVVASIPIKVINNVSTVINNIKDILTISNTELPSVLDYDFENQEWIEIPGNPNDYEFDLITRKEIVKGRDLGNQVSLNIKGIVELNNKIEQLEQNYNLIISSLQEENLQLKNDLDQLKSKLVISDVTDP